MPGTLLVLNNICQMINSLSFLVAGIPPVVCQACSVVIGLSVFAKVSVSL